MNDVWWNTYFLIFLNSLIFLSFSRTFLLPSLRTLTVILSSFLFQGLQSSLFGLFVYAQTPQCLSAQFILWPNSDGFWGRGCLWEQCLFHTSESTSEKKSSSDYTWTANNLKQNDLCDHHSPSQNKILESPLIHVTIYRCYTRFLYKAKKL